jgi:hypothetical protein
LLFVTSAGDLLDSVKQQKLCCFFHQIETYFYFTYYNFAL